MKKQYALEHGHHRDRAEYRHQHINHRHPRTTAERREVAGLKVDGMRVRGARCKLPQLHDDVWPSRFGKRSWKDFTRQRRQWTAA